MSCDFTSLDPKLIVLLVSSDFLIFTQFCFFGWNIKTSGAGRVDAAHFGVAIISCSLNCTELSHSSLCQLLR